MSPFLIRDVTLSDTRVALDAFNAVARVQGSAPITTLVALRILMAFVVISIKCDFFFLLIGTVEHFMPHTRR